jgi:hypothetical protein
LHHVLGVDFVQAPRDETEQRRSQLGVCQRLGTGRNGGVKLGHGHEEALRQIIGGPGKV